MTPRPFATIDELQTSLLEASYLADRGLASVLFLALKLEKPLLLEGEAGVGKTEVAKVMARMLETNLIRLQCYEGLDVNSAVYEWNYSRQMIEIRLAEEDRFDFGEQRYHLCVAVGTLDTVNDLPAALRLIRSAMAPDASPAAQAGRWAGSRT